MDLRALFTTLLPACVLLAGCGAVVPPVPPSAAELERLPVLSGVVTGRRVLRGEVYLADDARVAPGRCWNCSRGRRSTSVPPRGHRSIRNISPR